MQNNNDNNVKYTSCSSSSTDQQRLDQTRDDFVDNQFCKTKMYMNYFNVIKPVEKSQFSDDHLYSESVLSVFPNKTLSSNSISGTVDNENSFTDTQKCGNKSSGHHVNLQPQFNNNFRKNYRNNKNNAVASVKLGNVNNNTPFGYNHSQSACINDSVRTEPANKPTLNLETENTLTNSHLPNIKQDSEYDSEYESDSGDLEKMKLMTAADFNQDRYARYGIHESEIKDYVRTITYKNCIEYCSNEYIKVNINYVSV